MDFLNIQLQSFMFKEENNVMNSNANSRLADVLLIMNIAFQPLSIFTSSGCAIVYYY